MSWDYGIGAVVVVEEEDAEEAKREQCVFVTEHKIEDKETQTLHKNANPSSFPYFLITLSIS